MDRDTHTQCCDLGGDFEGDPHGCTDSITTPTYDQPHIIIKPRPISPCVTELF